MEHVETSPHPGIIPRLTSTPCYTIRKVVHKFHSSWWFYHRQTNSLWHHEATLWQRHGGIPQHTQQQGFHCTGQEDTPPPMTELEKATTTFIGQKLVLTSSSPCEMPSNGINLCHWTWINKFSIQWKLKLSLGGSQWAMMSALTAGLGYAVSDGSFKDDARAAPWIIEGPDSATRLTGTWHTPGTMADYSSFRSELAGIIGILHTISFWQPSNQPAFLLACNGLSFVTHLKSKRPIEPMEPHADLLCAACALLSLCGYTVEMTFIKGHQDTRVPDHAVQRCMAECQSRCPGKIHCSNS